MGPDVGSPFPQGQGERGLHLRPGLPTWSLALERGKERVGRR